jgi:putative endonuclease
MYIYILYNKLADKYYIGITQNVNQRLSEHNSLQSHYTGKIKGDWILVYSRFYKLKLQARKEEIRLKKAKNKKYLQWYINNK